MSHKHLHELLKEDQEPFQLKNFIADRRSHLKTSSSSSLQVIKKHRPIVQSPARSKTSRTSLSLCKQACFFSFQNSPDVRKSPLFDFRSPAKSPKNGAVFLHVPARTAALLLEAAMRIQNQQGDSNRSKSKTQIKTPGFGLLGSILKKLKDKSRSKRKEIRSSASSRNAAIRASSRSDFQPETGEITKSSTRLDVDFSFSCSCNNSRPSSPAWSESSTSSEDTEEYAAEEMAGDGVFASADEHFCSSPFRFSLQSCPSFGRLTPTLSSPAASPVGRREDKENDEAEGMRNQMDEEDEKDQWSPVSILDPPFVDDGGDEDGYDHQCSYAVVQRTKQQLLSKLRRFERLAELDPIELERLMMEDLEHNALEDSESACSYQSRVEDASVNDGISSNASPQRKKTFPVELDRLVSGIISKDALMSDLISNSFTLLRTMEVPVVLERLVSDLIFEEKCESKDKDGGEVSGRVLQKLDSWREVSSNTIDMMIEMDFTREVVGWKMRPEEVGETAKEIDIAIFELLLEELTEELMW